MTVSDHLTHIHSNVSAEQVRKTHKGMAHWAGSGPAGRTCRECRFWQGSDLYRYSVDTTLKPARCAKYAELTGIDFRRGHVPHYARACRHFEASPNPPSVRKRL